MIRIFLPATIGVILALGCLDARAMPASAPATMPYSGVNEMTHKGNYVVDFIEGKLVPSEPERAAPKAQSPETGREENYATSNVIMTLAFFAAFASTLAGFAAFGRFGRKETIAETTTEDAWKESLLEMLEADLRNLDSMTHGFSSR